MTEIVYTIKHRPDGKWMLQTGTASLGVYETQSEAREAMHRVITPEFYTYDKNGEPT